MRKLTAIAFFAIVAYFSFIGVALAQNAVAPDDGSILDLLKPIYEAVTGGQWWLGAMLGVVLLTTAAKRYLPGKAGAWVNGEYGQPLTVLLIAFGGAAATALMGSGAVFSAGLAWMALKVAVGAAGGYTLLKQLLAPLIAKVAVKAPAWMQPLFTMLLWVFSKPSAVEIAEKAGDDAVAAKPSLGTETTVGKPEKFGD